MISIPRYYMVGEYLRCSDCHMPQCLWHSELLKQLDPAHRHRFPAIFTTRLALDKKVVTLMKPRTLGNSSSYIHSSIEELHSEEWGRHVVEYLTYCELHKRGGILQGIAGATLYHHRHPTVQYHLHSGLRLHSTACARDERSCHSNLR